MKRFTPAHKIGHKMQYRTKKAASKALDKVAVKADSDSSSDMPTQATVVKKSASVDKKTVAPVKLPVKRPKKADDSKRPPVKKASDQVVDLGTMITESKALSVSNQFKHISKGKADVDEKFGMRSLWKVYEDASGNQYTSYLNKADLLDNNNKFYVLQLLQHVHTPVSCGIFTRYGRVGTLGVQEVKQMDLASAIKEYNKTFKQKTSKGKGYEALEMSSGGDDKKITVSSHDDTTIMEPSKLEPAVQGLMTFIHDKDAMEKSVIKAGYDVSKLPLGKLSDETIKEGYKYLS